jgi:hypothetical protein
MWIRWIRIRVCNTESKAIYPSNPTHLLQDPRPARAQQPHSQHYPPRHTAPPGQVSRLASPPRLRDAAALPGCHTPGSAGQCSPCSLFKPLRSLILILCSNLNLVWLKFSSWDSFVYSIGSWLR